MIFIFAIAAFMFTAMFIGFCVESGVNMARKEEDDEEDG